MFLSNLFILRLIRTINRSYQLTLYFVLEKDVGKFLYLTRQRNREVFFTEGKGERGGRKEGRNENEGRNDLRGNEARIGERFTDTVLTSGIFIK